MTEFITLESYNLLPNEGIVKMTNKLNEEGNPHIKYSKSTLTNGDKAIIVYSNNNNRLVSKLHKFIPNRKY